jgi:hypothetical protein
MINHFTMTYILNHVSINKTKNYIIFIEYFIFNKKYNEIYIKYIYLLYYLARCYACNFLLEFSLLIADYVVYEMNHNTWRYLLKLLYLVY